MCVTVFLASKQMPNLLRIPGNVVNVSVCVCVFGGLSVYVTCVCVRIMAHVGINGWRSFFFGGGEGRNL